MNLKAITTNALPKPHVAGVQAKYLDVHFYLLLRPILETQKQKKNVQTILMIWLPAKLKMSRPPNKQ